METAEFIEEETLRNRIIKWATSTEELIDAQSEKLYIEYSNTDKRLVSLHNSSDVWEYYENYIYIPGLRICGLTRYIWLVLEMWMVDPQRISEYIITAYTADLLTKPDTDPMKKKYLVEMLDAPDLNPTEDI